MGLDRRHFIKMIGLAASGLLIKEKLAFLGVTKASAKGAGAASETQKGKGGIAMTEKWNASGDMIETCSCKSACPCLFLSPPTSGDCKTLLGWHIDKGKFGDVALDGLNVVLAAYVPGLVTDGNWKVALYLDQRANDAQKDGLTKIFTGQVGGHPATLTPLIGQVLGIKSAPIEHKVEGKRRTLRISNVAEAESEALAGVNAAEVSINNPPLAFTPGEHKVGIAKSKRLSYSDYDLRWEFSENHASYLNFAYQGP